MFRIPNAVEAYWSQQDYHRPTAVDIARLADLIGAPLPLSYVDFITRYGFVSFDDIPGMQRRFDYFVFPSDGEVGRREIRFLLEPCRIMKAHEICTRAQSDDDEDFPKFPAKFLPVGNDAGQGLILIEFGEYPGRIWFWRENEWAWGMGDNTWLGFVANDFQDFIDRLQV